MATIPQVAEAMQMVLTNVAKQAAHESGFVQRTSKMDGAVFAQTLVFGLLDNPQASLESLCQKAEMLGVSISPQGLDQRFSKSAAECMQKVLESAVDKVFKAEPVAIPILQRFNGIYLDDSSIVTLPDELASIWQGCGDKTKQGPNAALKLQVRLDYVHGTLRGPFLQDGKQHDRKSVLQEMSVEKGSLRIADLGYWSMEAFKGIDAQDGYWLSRAQVQTKVYTQDGKLWHLVKLMQSIPDTQADLIVELGVTQRLPARLLSIRVPQQVADQRRQRLHEEAKRRGHTVSKARLALADWTLLVTNIPGELLSVQEAIVLARCRWQIELIFKLWKSYGQIDTWRSKNPWRVLCEVYAKLIAMVIQHWLLLVGCWHHPDRSLFKAAQTVSSYAIQLACAFNSTRSLSNTIESIRRCLLGRCRINKRKKNPHTYQLLLALTNGELT